MRDTDFFYSAPAKQIAELVPDVIYILDVPAARYLYLNRHIYQTIGYSDKELQTTADLYQVIHPGDLQQVKAAYHALLVNGTTDTAEYQYRLKKKADGYSCMAVQERVLERNDTGTPLRIFGVAQDISRYKEQIAQLQTVTDTFTSAFTYSGVGMALVSTEGHWLDVNKAVCNITGYSKRELLKMTFQDITYPDDLAVDLDLVQQMLNRKIDTYHLEKRYITKSGKLVWAILTVSLVWDEDAPRFFIAQIVDITRQKELAATLTQKNTELETTKMNLTAKIERLEELNHIIAHNLRGPAYNIQLLAGSLLAKETHTEDVNGLANDMTSGEITGLLNDASQSLTNNLNHLMELATISLDKHVPFDTCDVAQIYDGILTQLGGTIREQGADVATDFTVKTIFCPRHYLESILYNLVSNSLKYIAVKEKPQIKIATYHKAGRVILSVKDNGIGIDLKKYGAKMFKLNQVFHTGYDSKGVGLFLTKAQIEAIGGTIEVKSEPGQGAEFIVSFADIGQ